MSILRPFKGIRPKKELVKNIASKPYDVLNEREARVEAGLQRNAAPQPEVERIAPRGDDPAVGTSGELGPGQAGRLVRNVDRVAVVIDIPSDVHPAANPNALRQAAARVEREAIPVALLLAELGAVGDA